MLRNAKMLLLFISDNEPDVISAAVISIVDANISVSLC